MIIVEEKFGSTLKEWDRRTSRAVEAHYESAKKLRRNHYILGIVALVIVTLMGVLKDLKTDGEYKPICSAIFYVISAAATILISFQTFLNYGQRAEKHREAGSKYSSVRRKIEHLANKIFSTEEALEETIESLRLKIDSLSESTPEVLPKVWKDVRKKYDKSTYKSILFDK